MQLFHTTASATVADERDATREGVGKDTRIVLKAQAVRQRLPPLEYSAVCGHEPTDAGTRGPGLVSR